MLDALIKSAILFAIIAIATRLLKRRAPASLRHLLWSFAVVGALTVPLLSRVAPFRFEVLPATPINTLANTSFDRRSPDASAKPSLSEVDEEGADNAVGPATTNGPISSPGRTIPWMTLLVGVWALGALIMIARLVLGLAIVRRVAAAGAEIMDPEWRAHIDRAIVESGVRREVDVRMSAGTPVPYTCGLTRPTVVLPSTASDWSAERRDAVLLHELAHISRGDLPMNILSHVMRAIYWPNPLAWLAANGLRFEGERACDDVVLRAGARASDYADHLLDIVKSVGKPVPNVALAMARSSDFEGRLLAILEPGVPRTRLGRARAAGLATLFAFALVPLSAMTTATAVAAEPVGTPAQSAEESTIEKRSVNTGPLPQATPTIVALAEALGDATPAVRLAAVNSLGALQDPAAITALAKALREDTDARVREAAAWALGEIDDNRAVPHLLEALKGEKVVKVKVKIVEALREIDDPSALGGVTGLVKDGSPEVRRAAVEAIAEFEDQAGTNALIGLIKDDDVQVRRKVAEAFGSLGDPASVDALTAMARDVDSEVRANAIEALDHFESPKLVPVFVNALKDSDAHVREHAADALGSIDELKTAPRGLIDALADSDRDVRQNAAQSLANIGDEAAVPAIRKLVTDGDARTRRTAVEALKEIGGAEAMQALMGLLKDSDPEIRKLAAEALGKKR